MKFSFFSIVKKKLINCNPSYSFCSCLWFKHTFYIIICNPSKKQKWLDIFTEVETRWPNIAVRPLLPSSSQRGDICQSLALRWFARRVCTNSHRRLWPNEIVEMKTNIMPAVVCCPWIPHVVHVNKQNLTFLIHCHRSRKRSPRRLGHGPAAGTLLPQRVHH